MARFSDTSLVAILRLLWSSWWCRLRINTSSSMLHGSCDLGITLEVVEGCKHQRYLPMRT